VAGTPGLTLRTMSATATSPFDQLLDPANVLARIAQSQALKKMTGTVHRPMDKLRPLGDDAASEHDRAIDEGRSFD
jgi:hypothetical protein